MVCGTPFSVMMKSLAVRPSRGLPSLSRTLTVSTTSCVLEVNFTPPGAWAAGGCCAGACCAGIGGSNRVQQVRNERAIRRFLMLEPHPQIDLDGAHLVG